MILPKVLRNLTTDESDLYKIRVALNKEIRSALCFRSQIILYEETYMKLERFRDPIERSTRGKIRSFKFC